MKRFTGFLILLALLVAILAALFLIRPAEAEIEVTFPEWVTVTTLSNEDCAEGCYRIIYGDYQDDTESGGNILIMAKIDADGDGVDDPNVRWTVGYPGTEVELYTKPLPDWGDFPMYGGCFFPDQGESGPFYAYAGADASRSDKVSGMGLPYCHHVNYLIKWYWDPGGPPGPTATPTLPPVFNYWLYLPSVRRQ